MEQGMNIEVEKEGERYSIVQNNNKNVKKK